jgi:hypothetical protein
MIVNTVWEASVRHRWHRRGIGGYRTAGIDKLRAK